MITAMFTCSLLVATRKSRGLSSWLPRNVTSNLVTRPPGPARRSWHIGTLEVVSRNEFYRMDFTLSNEEIRPIVTQLSQERSNCIITGDTNINLLKVNERIKFQEYFDIFITNGLFPKITFPTRYNLNRNTATLIDHLFCKFIDGENCISSGILISNISDHLPYFAYIRLKKKITR